MPKVGLDYFPLDTALDTKFELLEANFGHKGFTAVVKLFQKIYGEQGYYCEWTEEIALLFAHKTGMSRNAVSDIVNYALRVKIFDADLYKKYNILTSAGIQKRYLTATSRRVQVELKKDYLLISDTLLPKNVIIIGGNAYRNQKNVCRNEQSKESKESKGSKVKREKNPPDAAAYYMENINPAPSRSVIEAISSYTDDGMTDECIIAIIDYCRDNAKTSWSYIRAAINNNFISGVRTIEDYKSKRAQFDLSKQTAEKETAVKKTAFKNFDERNEGYADLDDEYFAQFADVSPEQAEAEAKALLDRYRQERKK